MGPALARLPSLGAASLLALVACAHEARPVAHARGDAAGLAANIAGRGREHDSIAALRQSPHVMLGLPTDADPSDDLLLNKSVFVLSYNRQRNSANWVAWRLTADDLGAQGRSDSFRGDEELPAGTYQVQGSDYRGSGYDRGHLCPSSHRTRDRGTNSATFSMINMQPQVHALNAGPWKSLETHERALVGKEGKDIYVIAGGLFSANPSTIGPGVAVPRASYRVTVVLEHGAGLGDVTLATPVYAVEMPNDVTAKGHPWTDFKVSVDQVERDTGYDFLAALPDAIEAELEK